MKKAPAIEAIQNIIDEIQAATAAAKCHKCGCFHGALDELTEAIPGISSGARDMIQPVIDTGLKHRIPEAYDCIGCRVCWPANALNFAAEVFPGIEFGANACPTEMPAREHGWPPLPGDFTVLDNAGHVAVCALTSKGLAKGVVEARPGGVAIVGTLYTENLGIERIITNVLSNPNVTTLLICGADSEQRVGHLPGQAFLKLFEHGIDERGRIIDADGRRPFIQNITHDTVETFRKDVRILDRIGEEDIRGIVETLAGISAAQEPRRAERQILDVPRMIRAQPVQRLVLDPKGYFVVFPDREQQSIRIEHYLNDGTLAHVFTGECADDLCATVIDHALVSRLDHAAYLGKELVRAERALRTGEPYVQDRAPEPSCCASGGCTGNHKREY